MDRILVTGASRHLGRKTLQHLLKRRPGSDLVCLARDPEKAADPAAKGIEIRKGDCFDYGSLLNAFVVPTEEDHDNKIYSLAGEPIRRSLSLTSPGSFPTSAALRYL